ncbi:MAG TPA: AMP-binding protein [Streptosporangiaceae bacterium]|nr:AMP-binding protein [Streptosporangiaceae bacterium]
MAFAKVTDRYSSEQIERYYAAGVWRPSTLFDELEAQVAGRPDKVFITDGTTAYTFSQLRTAALRLAAGLAGRGIGVGDRVVVQLPNWTELAVITAALSRLGAIMVPVMPIYRSDDVRFVAETAEAKAAFTAGVFRGFDHARMFADLAAAGTGLQTVIAVRTETVPDGALAFGDILAGHDGGEDLPPSGIGPDDPFAVVFSSGTTSRPKGCLHTFNTYCASARLMGEAYHYTDADVQFGPSPVTHSTGLVTSILMPLVHGAGSHLMDIWEPREGLERIAKFRCTASVTATTFLQTLLTVYDPDQHDASSLRFWTSAGAPIPGAFVAEAQRTLPRMKVLSLYGRSENLCTTLCSIDDDPERSVTSDGRAAPGQEVRILDEHGDEVPRGTEGDIAFRGASNLLEYIGQPAATAEMFTADGFSKSGDLGVMDADGYVRVTGRLKDIVIRGGLNISVRQVEDLLIAHPAVSAVAAVGMPDAVLGERVCCYLVPAPGAAPLTVADMREYLLDAGLAIQKVPERVEVMTELPTTATGKIQKNLLRADIAAKLAEP